MLLGVHTLGQIFSMADDAPGGGSQPQQTSRPPMPHTQQSAAGNIGAMFQGQNLVVIVVLALVGYWLSDLYKVARDIPGEVEAQKSRIEALEKGLKDQSEQNRAAFAAQAEQFRQFASAQQEQTRTADTRLAGLDNTLGRLGDRFEAFGKTQERSDLANRDVQALVSQATARLAALETGSGEIGRRIERLSALMTEFRQAQLRQNSGTKPTGPQSGEEEYMLPPEPKPQAFKPAVLFCPCRIDFAWDPVQVVRMLP